MRWNDVPRGTMDEVRSHVCLDLPSRDGKAARKIVPPRSRIPYWKGLCAESEEKHEPASDIEHCLVDGLKALDPNRPIREADMCSALVKSALGHPRKRTFGDAKQMSTKGQ